MSTYQMVDVLVSQIDVITPTVKRFTLCLPERLPLPAFTGGSHIIVQMEDGERRYSNAYSLMNDPAQHHQYQIAVRLEEHSRGGSAFMHHQLRVGDRLQISRPNNLFALAEAPEHLLIAGGIGITPFLSQLHELNRGKDRYRLHYCFRDDAHCAFREDLEQAAFRDRVSFHNDARGERLDIMRLLADVAPDTHIYTCGPASLSASVDAAASYYGIAERRIHKEQFAIDDKGGTAFTLVLARSGTELIVGPDMTIIQAIENSRAATVECLCREGICGTCETAILEGEADHRDQYLSDEERAAQKTLLICCSRARGSRLVLDL